MIKINQEVVITKGPWKGEVGTIIGKGWSEDTLKVKVEDQSNPLMVNKNYLKVRGN
jgi:hypothetical protein